MSYLSPVIRNSFLLLITFFATYVQPVNQSADHYSVDEEVLSKEALLEDFAIMKEALMSLHPGLHRFRSKEDVEQLFNTFEASLDAPMTYPEAYVAFSGFASSLLCGHTHVNPWNQDDTIKNLIFEKEDKVPFTFQLIDGTMVVTQSAAPGIETGAVITAIDGVAVETIIDRLMTYVSTDGSNDGKRVYELQLTGIGDYELFDIYFPLVFPPSEQGYTVSGKQGTSMTPFEATLKPVTRTGRKELVVQKYGPQPESYDDLWRFKLLDERTGYLQIGTYVTYKMTLDWKGFLKDAFATLKQESIPNLIIDIRGNAGGMDEVNRELLRHINTTTLTIPAIDQRIAFNRVPDSVRPFVGTWDDRIYSIESRVEDTGKGYYVYRNASKNPQVYQPDANAYKGNVLLLVDAANSSATFFLARTAKEYGLATLIGQPTGGNLKGTNGGQMFFLRLPNSKIEMDVPIYGFFPFDEEPDRGVIPDIVVAPLLEDARMGKDTVLEAALAEIE